MIACGRKAGVACLVLAATVLAASQSVALEPAGYPQGAAVFAANCSVCHGPKGLGQPSLAPPLTVYPALYATIPEGRRQLVLTVLNGMFGTIEVEGRHFDFKMPEFTQLDDAALAAVLNYVVFELAQAGPQAKPLSAADIAAERAHPMDGAAVREHRTQVLSSLGR